MIRQLRHSVFWPPFIVLSFAVVYSMINTEGFLHSTTLLYDFILNQFGALFSVSALLFLVLCIVIYFSPMGHVTIGGKNAKPLLSRWRWFSITLCTTIATGILFWGTAEPLFHLHDPPTSFAYTPSSQEAATFSLSTMYMHWSFIPYAFYTLVALAFALTYYNLKQPFSLGSLLFPLFGNRIYGRASHMIDMISLFSLVAGMAASLGAGILILSGGLHQVIGLSYSSWVLAGITIAIVSAFILSATSGLMKGIRILSDVNTKVFIVLALFVFICGPTLYLLSSGGIAALEFIRHFFSRSLIGVVTPDIEWARSWTIFNWGNWLAWTPVTALFLGRIAVGYSVRQFIHFNLLLPSIFGCLWMMVFSGSAIYYDIMEAGSPLYTLLNQEGGTSRVIYSIFDRLPFSTLVSYVFLGISFLSYVTAADSNTTAMSSISTVGLSANGTEPPAFIKITWGIIIGIIAWIMISFSGQGNTQGLDGIKMLSNLGGFPVLFFVILVGVSMVKLMWRKDL